MNTLIKLAVALFLIGNLNAQTAAPEPPSTYNSTYSSSTSVSKTDDDYRFKAKFHKSRYDAVRALLVEQLGNDELSKNGKTYQWSYNNDSFSCKLTGTTLRIYLDYELSNETFIKHIENLGSDLKYAISGGDPKEDMKRAEKDIKRAEEDLARAKKELERTKAQAKRTKKN